MAASGQESALDTAGGHNGGTRFVRGRGAGAPMPV